MLPLKALAGSMQIRTSIYLLALRFLAYRNLEDVSNFMIKYIHRGHLPVALETGSIAARSSYLYGSFMNIATIDAAIYSYVAQRIPGGIRNPRLSLPAGLIANSLVVLDEVQLLQDEWYYPPRILNKILRQLAEARVLTVIMTATMPTMLKNVLLEGLETIDVKGKNSKRGTVMLESYTDKTLIDVLSDINIIGKIKQTLKENNKHVLIVANTVKRACLAYEKIKEMFDKHDVLLIHGRFTNLDRRILERNIEEQAKIIVSTQVIESGFDLDAGLMITEIAPLDSLLQRIGRIARNYGSQGEALIVKVNNANPYNPQLLENTEKLLRENIDEISNALNDIDLTNMLLDAVYTRDIIKNMKGYEAVFVRSDLYLSKIRLFSLAPENLEFRLRPELYVTLVINQEPKDVELRDKWRRLISGESLDFQNFNEMREFLSELETRALNISVKMAGKLRSKILGRLVRYKVWSEGRCFFRVSLQKIPSENYDLPMGLYVISEDVYSKELGLNISETNILRRRESG